MEFFNKTIFKVALITILAAFVSCRKEKPEVLKDPSVSITVLSTSVDSVSFRLEPENAVSVSYACVKAEEVNYAELTDIDGGEDVELTIGDLEEGKEYAIVAVAANAEGKVSPRVTETFVTTKSASVKIFVREQMAKALKVVFTPVNAAYYEYACTLKGSGSAEFIRVDNGETLEYLFENLEPETEYVISARATNSNGETGEMSEAKAVTTSLPELTVEQIEPSAVSVKVNLSVKDAVKVYYYVGKDVPSDEDYKQTDIKNDVCSFTETDLESDTEYTLYCFAEDKNGFRSEMVSETFRTILRGDSGVEVRNIGMRDADIEVFFNNEKYSKIYYISGNEKMIADPAENPFDWEAYKRMCTVFTENASFKFSEYMRSQITVSTLYRCGIIAEDADGNLVSESEMWTEFKTGDAVFGKSEASVEISVDAGCNSAQYRLTPIGDGAKYIISIIEKVKLGDVNEYAMTNMINGQMLSSFGESIKYEGLIPETDYAVVVIPVDSNGNYGDVVRKDFTTTQVEFIGKGTVEVDLMTVGVTHFIFDCKFGTETASLRYMSVKTGEGALTEDEVVNELVSGFEHSTIYAEKRIDIMYLEADSEYIVYFMAVDKEGNFSELEKVECRTKKFVIDGNAEVNIVRLNDFMERPYAYLDYRIEKGANCKGYYRCWIKESEIENKSDQEILNLVLNPQNYFVDTIDNPKESIWLRSWFLVVPVDNEDRLSPIVKIKLENTFEDVK